MVACNRGMPKRLSGRQKNEATEEPSSSCRGHESLVPPVVLGVLPQIAAINQKLLKFCGKLQATENVSRINREKSAELRGFQLSMNFSSFEGINKKIMLQ